MLRLTMLPASYGDAIWLEYGDPTRPKVVIVDCGFRDNYRDLAARVANLQPGQLELLILTHVDEDHIKGAIPLLADERFMERRGELDVWFNGWEHLNEGAEDGLGAVQGEFFSSLILDRGYAWNAHEAWSGAAVVVPASGKLPHGKLAGGLEWTLLSPTPGKLASMRDVWEREVAEAKPKGLQPGDHERFLELFSERKDLQPDALGGEPDVAKLIDEPFEEDDKAANGSSIALLVEYREKSVLLGADAHPTALEVSLRRLAAERGVNRINVNALKVSHHGSRKNTSPGMLGMLDCDTFLFSSNGNKFGHPSPQCVARIISHRDDGAPVQLRFNYDSDITKIWRDVAQTPEHPFELLYPEDGGPVFTLQD